MFKKLSYLLVLKSIIVLNLFAGESLPWNDQIIPLSPSSYYESFFATLLKDVDYRYLKYFNNYAFAPWKIDKSDAEIKEEFLHLSRIRSNIWFDTDKDEIERGWRKDFRPNFELLFNGTVRHPNCIAFDFNKVGNYYNGSLIEADGFNFLALEAPLDNTVHRFFYALLDTNAPLLIRLTPEKENDIEICSPYWKDRLINDNQLAVPRHKNSPKNIYYLGIDDWNDSSATNAKLLLELVLKARSLYDPSKGPLAVQCISGSARAGTFIAAYCLIHEIDDQIASGVPIEKIKLSIENLVARLSLQRYHMVARPSQYLSLYQMVQMYLNGPEYLNN